MNSDNNIYKLNIESLEKKIISLENENKNLKEFIRESLHSNSKEYPNLKLSAIQREKLWKIKNKIDK